MVVVNTADGGNLRQHYVRVGIEYGERFNVILLHGGCPAALTLSVPPLRYLDVGDVFRIVFFFKAAMFKRNVVDARHLSQQVVVNVQSETAELGNITRHVMQDVVSRRAVIVDNQRPQLTAKAVTLNELCVTIKAQRRRARCLHNLLEVLRV